MLKAKVHDMYDLLQESKPRHTQNHGSYDLIGADLVWFDFCTLYPVSPIALNTVAT